jgi:hypothetical protein
MIDVTQNLLITWEYLINTMMNLEQTKIRRYIAYIQLPVKVHGFHFAVLILVYSVFV